MASPCDRNLTWDHLAFLAAMCATLICMESRTADVVLVKGRPNCGPVVGDLFLRPDR